VKPVTGIKPTNRCFESGTTTWRQQEETMSKTKIMLATLALGATVALAGPAFAEKMKVTLDSKSEVPPNTSAGTDAGVKVPIPNATSSPAEGSAILTDEQAADLTAGKYYINVHTAANPGGEIRGQVTK